MTAHAMQGDRERCFEAGMNGYVSKPVDPLALAEELEKWLTRGNDELGMMKDEGGMQAVKEEPAEYIAAKADNEPLREETAAAQPSVTDKKPNQPATDWKLYKCQGCGQMVMGFDREKHVNAVHGDEGQDFKKL